MAYVSHSHVGSIIDSVYVEPLWAQVSLFCKFSCSGINPSGSYNPSFPSSTGFPKFYLMSDYGSLHQFPSVAGWSPSDDSYTNKLLSANIAEYY